MAFNTSSAPTRANGRSTTTSQEALPEPLVASSETILNGFPVEPRDSIIKQVLDWTRKCYCCECLGEVYNAYILSQSSENVYIWVFDYMLKSVKKYKLSSILELLPCIAFVHIWVMVNIRTAVMQHSLMLHLFTSVNTLYKEMNLLKHTT